MKKVTIIGGGIAGLTTAIALNKIGIETLVFESAPEIKALGAGLTLGANAMKAFKHIGIADDIIKARFDRIPRSQGGRTTWENIVCSCIPCNLRKGGRTPEAAGMVLKKRPLRPRWYQVLRPLAKVPFEDWRPFLNVADLSYWNVELETEDD